MYLRNAAERVGVLHVFFMTRYELAAFEYGAHFVGYGNLSGMMTHFVHLLAERFYTAVECFERHGRNAEGGIEETACAANGPCAVGRHELCAVEQREAFF